MSYQGSALKKRKTIYLLVISLIVAALWGNVYPYNLTVDVADMGAYPGDLIEIPIYMTNTTDTVHAFELWLVLSRPDLIQFNEDPEPRVVLTGTLCSGWGVAANSIGSLPYDLKISASADIYDPGILPQDGTVPLIKVLAQVYDIPDSFPERVVQIFIQHDNPGGFSFSDPHGKSIGVITDSIVDSSCYHCEVWYEDTICLFWVQVDCENPQQSIDSTWCCDTILVGTLDTSYVHVEHGQVEVSYCGDFSNDGGTNLLDIVELINCIYSDIPPGSCIGFDLLDADCDGATNIIDIVYYIAYLYQNGPAVECCQ